MFDFQLSYAIIWMEGYCGGAALGFFSLGCAPGGGMSNMFAHLLGGDMSISITLTLLSTIICIGEPIIISDVHLAVI